MSRWILLTILLGGLSGGISAQDAPPGLFLFEAEDTAVNSASTRKLPDPDASGQRYVFAGAEYAPLFMGDHPAMEAPRLSFWARVRGVAIQLKTANPDGTQTEKKWDWTRAATWRWVHLGTYERDQLGTGFVIIRGPGAAPGSGLDSVIISTDPAFRPQEP